MTYIISIINKLFANLTIKTDVGAPSFFDYSAEEKKKIIQRAADESIKMQEELIRKYNKIKSNKPHYPSTYLN